ncbi:MAG: ribonuclease HII [Streptosporangiaceae bacterium]
MSGADEEAPPGRTVSADINPEAPEPPSDQPAGDGDDTARTDEDGTAEAAAASAETGPAGAGPRRRRRTSRKRSFWRELPILVAIALLLAVVIKTYAIQAFYIPSGSMENTLEINDRVLVNKIIYHIRDIHRGDIVVFNGDGSWDPGAIPVNGNIFQQFGAGFASMFGFGHPGDILIKRVIGLPDDRVACCDAQGQVTVNGVPLAEQSYLYPGAAPSLIRFNITVPPGRLWVMGDNRYYSDDSREHMGDPGGGTVPESAVVGRAFVIIWPPSRWRFLPIPATFENPKLSPASAAAGPDGPVSARLTPASPAVPLALGFTGALPLTWAQRRVRMRVKRRRQRRRARSLRCPPRCPRQRHIWRNLRSVMTRHPGAPAVSSPPSLAVPAVPLPRYAGYTPRRDGGLGAYETVLDRAGFGPVAGIDEAGRGACAGPLVVAAVVLDPGCIRRIRGLADSKLLTAAAREQVYAEVLRWALDWHVVIIGADAIDATGLHVCNVAGMRRACAGLRCRPGYVLTDGFPVRGLGAPALAVWKGDRVTASVAAASVVAKVSRDRMMRDLHERYPQYGFDRHKGYNTDDHVRALTEHGPSPAHRYSFVNVNRVAASLDAGTLLDPLDPVDLMAAEDPADVMDVRDPGLTPVPARP